MTMKLIEIADVAATLELDPDEAMILAAACRVASAHLEGSEPTINPFERFGSDALCGVIVDAYGALFEAVAQGATAHFATSRLDHIETSLSGIREYGTGARLPRRKESEAGDVA